jgi:hypothetical protein
MLPCELRVVSFVLAQLRRVPLPEDNSHQVAFRLGYLDALKRVADALAVPQEAQTHHRPGNDPAGKHAA